MNRIKTFKIFESEDNHAFIKFLVGDDFVYENGKYSTKSSVFISNYKIEEAVNRGILESSDIEKLPIEFDRVFGGFTLEKLGLKSLQGSPRYVKDVFSVSGNDLEDLSSGPGFVGDTYTCFGNKLRSLKGSPDKVVSMYAESNLLENLVGGPKTVTRNLYLDNNPIKSFEGLPESIGGTLSLGRMSNNPNFSLKGLHDNIGKVSTDYFSIPWTTLQRIDFLITSDSVEGKKLLMTFYEGSGISNEEKDMLVSNIDKIGIDFSEFDLDPDLQFLLRSKSRFI